jgi:hypothetical protein
VPDSAAFWLPFSPPISLSSADPATVVLALRLRPTTAIEGFRVRIAGADWVDAVDANSGAAVPLLLAGGAFPIVTRTVLVTDRPTEVSLSVESAIAPGAALNRGQDDVSALAFTFHASGDPGVTSLVRILGLSVSVADSAGAPLALALSRVAFADDQVLYGEIVDPVLATGVANLTFSTPLVVPVNTERTASLRISLRDDVSARHLRFRIADPLLLPTARDGATGSVVPVCLALSASAASGPPSAAPLRDDPDPAACPFSPWEGPLVRIESRPAQAAATHLPRSNRSAYAGTAGVPLLGLAIRHPGGAGDAGISIDSILVTVTDTLGAPQPAGERLLALRARRDTTALGQATVAGSAQATVRLPIAGVSLAPGDTALLELAADLRPGAPPGALRVTLEAAGLRVSDENERSLVPLAAEGVPFPFVSATISVLAPPEDPIASFRDHTPVTVTRGEGSVAVATLRVLNPAGQDAGPVELEAVQFACEDAAGGAIAAGDVVARMRALRGAAVVAQSSPLAPCRLDLSAPITVAPGETLALAFELDVAASPAADAFRLVLADSMIVLARPGEGIAAPRARAAAGETFPFATDLVGVAAADLVQSLSNYPNPFAAGREETRFFLYLVEPAEIEIQIYTALGEEVARIVPPGQVGPGTVQGIAWDGRNDDGETVLSGVYLANVNVRYASGRAESLLRKVAVLR